MRRNLPTLLGYSGKKRRPFYSLQRQSAFAYSTCGLFTKNEERIQKFKETGDSRCIYQNELDKPCFQQDMVYGDFKDLPRRTGSDKVFHDKEFNF